jgi:hypothetical protein
VTPVFKQAAQVNLKAVSTDASRVIVQSFGNFGDAGNDQETGAQYALTRSPTGWVEAGIDPPAFEYPFDEFLAASPDLSETLWRARAKAQSIYAQDLYTRDAAGALRSLGPTAPPSATEGPPGLGLPPGESSNNGFGYQGASSDFSHVLFTLESPNEPGNRNLLWPGDTTVKGQITSLYEYAVGESEPKLVGVKNKGPLASNTTAELISDCGAGFGASSGSGAFSGDTYNAVSADGSVVFFTATAATEGTGNAHCNRNNEGSGPPVNELYARVGGVKTVAISESTLPPGECTSPHACFNAIPKEGIFQGASQDGSKVFFLTDQPLLNSDQDTTTDLYEAEIEGEGESAKISRLVQVSHDPITAQVAEVQGVARVSEDGSHVYFVAKGVLAGNSNGQAPPFSTAQLGAENLYVYGPDPANPSQSKTVFIGMLCSEAGTSGSVSDPECHSSDEKLWNREDFRPAQATPDGRFLAFSSATDLTAPEDTSTVTQIFRYDVETSELARVSIGQNGFNANGNTDNSNLAAEQIRSPRGEQPSGSTAISDDGSVVFQSADGLTPAALNGQEESYEYEEETQRLRKTYYAQNVYRYHENNVQLISDGLDTTATEGASSVRLDGMTSLGTDVFFETADQLVRQDTDTQRDLYDARINGGFPPPPVSTPCQEACQGSPGSQPLFGAPSSATFSGFGNLAPPVSKPAVVKHKSKPVKCKKGFVKKRNKCVKNKSKKKAKKASRDRRAK